MTKQLFNREFLENVLSDWNYKQIIINGKTIYDTNRDVVTTLNDFYNKCKELEPLVNLYWTDINITPATDYKEGVCISFNIGADIW